MCSETTTGSAPNANTHATIYFAYGSNLRLKQMAKRCPQSRFLGIGKLQGYRWQINNRGYANVVADGDYKRSVHGICYLISDVDESKLDEMEGVDCGAYEKRSIDIEVLCQPVVLAGQDVSVIVEHDRLSEVSRHWKPCWELPFGEIREDAKAEVRDMVYSILMTFITL